MNRQVVGVLVLALAAVGIVVTSQWLNPHIVDGRALVEPPPPPPAVGACLAWSEAGDATGGAVDAPPPQPQYPVSCEGEHAGEVFHVYDPAPAAGTVPESSPCTGPGVDIWSYLGVPGGQAVGGWQPAIDASLTVFGPDPRQYESGQRWLACVIAGGGSRPTLTGSVRATDDGAGPPPQLSLCEAAVADDFTQQGSSTCGDVHGTEVFAVREPVAGDTTSALGISCRELVVRDTGRASLPDEPGLRVAAEIYQFVDDSVQPVELLPAGGDGWARCVVQAVDGRSFTGSLRRLGADPIPWAP